MDYREDRLTGRVIGCIIRVHQELGPGFLESVYRRALVVELKHNGLAIQAEKEVEVRYKGELVGTHKLDLLVESRLVVELKTVERLCKANYAQVRSYLRATGLPLALLANFALEKADVRRVEANPSLISESPASPSLLYSGASLIRDGAYRCCA